MKVKRVRIDRRPGLESGLEVELGAGLNVVLGTNASGKSSLCRTVFEVLWNDPAFRGAARVDLEHAGRAVTAEREGSAPTRWSGGAPALPDAGQRRTFFLGIEDLFDARGDEELALNVRRELGRGYDLALPLAAERRLTGASPQATRARAELERLVDARARVEREQEALDGEARALEEHRAELDRARAADEELRRVERALEAQRALARREDLARELASFPPGIEKLHAQDGARLAACQRDEQRAAQARDELRDRVAAARARAQVAGLPDGGLVAEELAVIERAADVLERGLGERDEASRELAAASARLDERAGEGLPEVALAPADLVAIETAVAEVARARARSSEQTGYVESLTGDEGEELARPVARLRGLAGGVVALGVLLLVAAAYLQGEAGGVAPVVLAVAGALELVLGLLGAAASTALARVTAERDVLLRAAERRLARDEARRRDAEEALATRLTELGLDPTWGALALDGLGKRLADRREAQVRVEEARATLAEVESQAEEARRSLARVLASVAARNEGTGEATGGAGAVDATVADPVVLLRACRGLAGRERERREAADAVPELEARLERAEQEVVRAAEATATFFRERGLAPGDAAGLRTRLDVLPRWSEASQELRDLDGAERAAEETLGAHAALLREPTAALEERRRALAEAHGKREALVARITELEGRLERARAGTALADARAAERGARETLAGVRDDALVGAAAEVLARDVFEEHRREVRAGLLPRATRAFAHFTGGTYRLDLPAEGDAEELGVVVRSTEDDRAVPVVSLSTGTRAQLLLALRTALAQEVEGAEPLPLFLDETLASSDPERFRSVVRSLAGLVRDGRQVVLLTAEPILPVRAREAAAELGVETTVVDVDLARSRARLAPVPESLARTAPRSDPDPADFDTPGAYAEAIGVPGIDPWRPAAALHPFHLAFEDLSVVRRLRAHRLETVGAALQVVADGSGHGLTEEEARTLVRRAALADAWLAARAVGRPRPLTRADLVDGALQRSRKYADDALALAEELEGDGRRWIAALLERSDPRLRGFRRDIAEALRGELAEKDLWTDREPLEGDALLRDAITRASTAGVAVDPAELERAAAWIEAWIAAGGGESALPAPAGEDT